ncbi:MAG: hypothetical protein A2Y81_01430 [Nitrospirae bacterium RBG_13_43_8]|nr:MAG: hypothetical protein A2Y81_01430 [Nitrospirae bacterium RBG_13_43_8]
MSIPPENRSLFTRILTSCSGYHYITEYKIFHDGHCIFKKSVIILSNILKGMIKQKKADAMGNLEYGKI